MTLDVDSHMTKPGRPRRFMAFNVGTPKSGTVSLTGIFSRYRSAHEYLFSEASPILVEYAAGTLSREDLRHYLIQRDERGRLEMDAACFHYSYVDVLAEQFPAARFIFTVRECYSWVNSAIDYAISLAPVIPTWLADYLDQVMGLGMTPEVRVLLAEYSHAAQDGRNAEELAVRRASVVEILPGMVDQYLASWTAMNARILDALPADRSLVLPTREISTSLPHLARWLGVEKRSLNAGHSHLNKAPHRFNLLGELDPEFVHERGEYHCSELMRRLFPEHTGHRLA